MRSLTRCIAGPSLERAGLLGLTLILALCEMLEKRGVDPDNLLEGMTFNETMVPPNNKHERFGTA